MALIDGNQGGGRTVDRVSGAQLANELAGEAVLICTRGIKYGGRQYTIGDEITLAGGQWDDLLLKQGAFTSRKRWEASRAQSAERKFKRDVIEPLEQVRNRVVSAEGQALAEIAEAQAALRAAQDRAVAAASQRERAEKDIADALAGNVDTEANRQAVLQADLSQRAAVAADAKARRGHTRLKGMEKAGE